MEKEYLEIRFGVVAVKKGFVTPDQIVKAMEVQVAEDLKSGIHRPLGTILFEQELITARQLQEVLRHLENYNN